MRALRPLLPILILMTLLLAGWLGGALDGLSWAGLAANQARLVALVSLHPFLAPLTYVALYATLAALSFPAGALLTVTGGLLFGPVLGCALAVTGATSGAIMLFLAARSALAETLRNRGGAVMRATRERLARDGFSYLLALRLLPVVPFWLVNLAGALCGMRLVPFVLATAIGIIPVAFVFATVGAGIGDVLAAGGKPDLSIIFAPRILLPLLALAALSLLPVLLKKRMRADG